jgi:hypothetical protein
MSGYVHRDVGNTMNAKIPARVTPRLYLAEIKKIFIAISGRGRANERFCHPLTDYLEDLLLGFIGIPV